VSVTSTRPTTVRLLVPLCYVEDIGASVDFYTRVLDFRMTHSWEPDGRLTWCQVTRGGAAVMLQRMTPKDTFVEPRGDGVTFYFHCDDAMDVYERLVDRGIAVDPPIITFYGMKQVFVTDPDGYRLCFQNPADPPASEGHADK